MRKRSNAYNGRDNTAEYRQQRRMNKLSVELDELTSNYEYFIQTISRNFNINQRFNRRNVDYEKARRNAYEGTSWFVSGHYYHEWEQNTSLDVFEQKLTYIFELKDKPRTLVGLCAPYISIPLSREATDDEISNKQWSDRWNAGSYGSQRTQNDRMTKIELDMIELKSELKVVRNAVASELSDVLEGAIAESRKRYPRFNEYQNKFSCLVKCAPNLLYYSPERHYGLDTDVSLFERIYGTRSINDGFFFYQITENIRDQGLLFSRSPVYKAIEDQDVNAIEALVKMGFSIETGNKIQAYKKETELHYAVKRGNLQVIEKLLSLGANPNAAVSSESSVITTLTWVSRCCDNRYQRTTPLHIVSRMLVEAFKSGNTEKYDEARQIYSRLIEYRANPNIRDFVERRTPREILAENDLTQVIDGSERTGYKAIVRGGNLSSELMIR